MTTTPTETKKVIPNDQTAQGGRSAVPCSVVWSVDPDKEFGVKSPCPYCGGKITAIANAWEEDEDKLFFATDLDISCSNEPDLDKEEEWHNWNVEHGRGDDNEAWHRLYERILRSMKAKVRFNLQNEPVLPARLETTDTADQ
jgi:hypothetical protein